MLRGCMRPAFPLVARRDATWSGVCCRLVCANLRELPVGQWLREDAVVDEPESVPFGGGFGLEVPEDPTIHVSDGFLR